MRGPLVVRVWVARRGLAFFLVFGRLAGMILVIGFERDDVDGGVAGVAEAGGDVDG